MGGSWRWAVVLVAALAMAAQAGTVKTGLYRMAKGDQGQAVRRCDVAEGGEVRLGQFLTGQLGQASLVSTANDNSRFELTVEPKGMSQGLAEEPMVIVVAGMGMPVSGYGFSGPGESRVTDLTALVTGRAAAEKVGRALGIRPKLRQHPGYQLLVTLKPRQPSYHPREPVTLVMTIKNVGTKPVRFCDGGKQRGPRNNQFSFVAFPSAGPALPDVGDPTNLGGLMSVAEIRPGETFSKDVDLTKWFNFTRPDQYQVTAIYELNLVGEDHVHIIWDDFAVGRCTVTISEPGPGRKADQRGG